MNQASHCFTENRIDAIELACVYGFNQLFGGLNFSVTSGTALRIMGSNGAGKTSLLRILCGLSLPESGAVQLNGTPINKCANEYRGELSYLGHKTGLKDDLTPLENLKYLSSMAPTTFTQSEEILLRLGIGPQHEKPCRQLSAGQRQRTALARTIASGASIWLLDEPATALDGEGIDLLAEEMQQHLDRNGLIIFSSHQSISLNSDCLQEVSWDKPTMALGELYD